ERGEGKKERGDVLAQHVTAEDAHGRSRHYIRTSSAVQGMPRPTLAGFLALSLIIPQAYAQDRAAPDSGPRFVASFHHTPLATPRNVALEPGGRLAPRTSPALVAAAWAAQVRASLPQGFVARAFAVTPPGAAPAESAAALALHHGRHSGQQLRAPGGRSGGTARAARDLRAAEGQHRAGPQLHGG